MTRLNTLLWLFGALCLLSCQNSTDARHRLKEEEGAPKRFGMVTELKPEKAAYYKQLHANAWPGVLATIRACNIRNYSIYLKEIEGELYLFSYYEYYGDDYAADMEKMAADSITQRWWRETDPCQQPLPEATAENSIWTDMEEVFYAK